ncbi:LOW QUALITY PROTEIN: protein split ends-like [Homarus americanus]|uniref:LOW QUALITY PROTEIN: protein split ends-like n=1 Tax=Homarus americanus TaxID=6706 RepID=UPI001C44B727|nr:LOW QUALITY PROTEIN: protein split ends-like [Homarus americanus]
MFSELCRETLKRSVIEGIHAFQDLLHSRTRGGGDGRESSGGSGGSAPSANGHSSQQQQEQQSHSAASKRSPAQKGQVSFTVVTSDIDIGEDGASMSGPEASSGTTTAAANNTGFQGLPPLPPGRSRWSCSVDTTDAYWFAQDDNTPPSKQQRASFAGPNDLIFGEDDRSSGLSYKDREDRVRQLRERQQIEKQQKLEELKEQGHQSKAALAQRFREHQENERRRRLEEMRLRDADRRSQVEERKRIIQQAEQDRREAVIRKNTQERDHRMESKRRNERSNIVFAFGSSTPRMLDPKDSSTNASYWSSRRATSTTNVHLVDTSITRRASECGEMDLSRKRATSAQGLDRKPEDLRMSSSMYEVFHWDESSSSHQNHPPSTQGTRLTKSRDSSLERKTPPSALIWVRSSTPQPTKSSSLPLSSKDASAPPSSTSSSSSDKTPTNSSQSRFCVWEFGDNFAALGPANQSSGGSGNPAPSSPASTPTSSTCYSRRTASVFTGAGCTIGGEDLMTRSMTAAIPASAEHLIPAMPSLTTSGTSRSSPRHRSPGMRSGTVTPNSPSRPTSALSQGSNNSSQVSLRSRTSPRKPRPLSIAGTSLSSADKPRDPTTPSRESRPMERKLSIGSTSSTSKPTRAKSAGSDRSAPATPARTPVKAATPKKTPSQVKAESAAKKAVEKSKTTPKTKSTPKTTPSQSPAVESKPLPGTKEDKKKIKEDKTLETKLKVQKSKTESINDDSVTEMQSAAKTNGADSQLEAIVVDNLQPEKDIGAQIEPTSEDSQAQVEPVVEELALETKKLVEESVKPDGPTVEETESQGKQPSQTSETLAQDEKLKDESKDKLVSEEKLSVPDIQESSNKLTEDDKIGEPEKTLAQKAAEKPVTGYATEEEYKAALAEKRRIAREAKERELELERQKKLDEEERERKEEEEFLKMIAEQKKSEEERLRKAIEEADRNREEEAKRREEEEKQREEAERLEQQKRIETEERLRREEEERQARKSRVAAIMARTRGKGGSNTPTKAEAKTPSDEAKNFGDGEMSISMTDSMMSSIIASESQSEPRTDSQPATSTSDSQASTQPLSDVSLQPASDVISQPSSDTNAAPTSDVSLKSDQHHTDSSSQSQTTEIAVDSKSSVREEVMYSKVEVTSTTENYQVDDLISGMSSIKVEEPHVNGDSPVPMDTTPTQSVDLLGTLSDVHSVNHNGVDNTPPQTTQGTDNLLGSLDPLNSSLTSTTTITPAASNFDQIIDLGQTKLSNEDAVNSNPPSPFIAFEQNLNKKQNQENNSTVPDLLL